MKEIISPSNSQYKLFVKLVNTKKYRHREKSYLAEGVNALDTPKEQVLGYLVSYSQKNRIAEWKLEESKVILLADVLFRELSNDVAGQGIIVWTAMAEHHWEKENWQAKPNALYLAMEDIQDAGNLGTMIRTAEGAGVDAIFCSENTVDLYHPKVIKSTASSLSRMKIYTEVSIPELLAVCHRQKIISYATSPVQAKAYTEVDFRGSGIVLIGNEGNGLQPSTIAMAQQRIYIPMSGRLESLNAAISAAIVLYEAKRQRGQ